MRFEATVVIPEGQGCACHLNELPKIDHSFINEGKAYRVYDVIHNKVHGHIHAYIMLRGVPPVEGKGTVQMIKDIQNGKSN